MYPKAEITYSDKDSILMLRENRCSKFMKKTFRNFLALLIGVVFSSAVSEGIYYSAYRFSRLENKIDLLNDNCLVQLPFYILKKSYDAEFLHQISKSQTSLDLKIGLEQISQEYEARVDFLTQKLNTELKRRHETLVYDPMITIVVINFVFFICFVTLICLRPQKPQTMYGNHLKGYRRLMWVRWYLLCFCWVFFLCGACHLGKALAVDCSGKF